MKKNTATPSAPPAAGRAAPRYIVRPSSIHGSGVFARTDIAAGARVGEYRGQRVSRAEMERRWQASVAESGHTFFFVVDDDRIIDASVNGNGIRFINHSCAPNCTTVLEGRRVYVDALRFIPCGAELTYDYLLEPGDEDEALDEYACACGARRCRRSMVDPAVLRRIAKRKRSGARSARP